MTVTDLIKQSLRLLRVYGPGETPTATELADGMAMLNEMIDAWNAERHFIFNVNRTVWPLVAGQLNYTIGPSGNFNTVRPVKVEAAGVILDSSVSNPIEVPLEVLVNHEEWSAIYLKTLPSTYPRKLYYEPLMPLGVINLWPVTSGALTQLVLYTWNVLVGFTTVGDTVTLPPGYATLLRTNFAVWVAEEYGVTPTENVINQAREAKARVKDSNMSKSVPILTTDYPQSERGRFNIILGDWKQ